MFPTLLRRTAESAGRKFDVFTNPYRAKKVWPPDFTGLSPQAQLRFEKKYKRRLALVYARPRWDKAIKLIQLVTVTGWCRAWEGFPTFVADEQQVSLAGRSCFQSSSFGASSIALLRRYDVLYTQPLAYANLP